MIEALALDEIVVADLSDLLIDVVSQDGSVGFRHPVSSGAARDYWRAALADPGRVVLGARRDGRVVGTVTLFLDMPDNQPHRAEIWKMMVSPSARRAGLADALLKAVEAEASRRGRSLLNLDTVTGGPASRIYERGGWIRSGDIPDYALTPMGALSSTTIYYKRLEPAA